MISLLFKGAIMGFSTAAPVGPIGIRCIQKSLSLGSLVGLVVGLGAATADAIYAAIAGFGLTTISSGFIHHQHSIHLIGGFFLLYLGIKTFSAKPPQLNQSESSVTHLLSIYFSTFLLTITNPIVMISFLAIFAALGLGSMHMGHSAAALLVLGVFCGSVSWWLILSQGINFFKSFVKPIYLTWVNRLSGLLIFLFGLVVLF